MRENQAFRINSYSHSDPSGLTEPGHTQAEASFGVSHPKRMNPPPNDSPGQALPLKLGPIGLGCVTFGREIDEAAAFALMDHAVERGVTFFDTAAAYAAGASERVVGSWLAARSPGKDGPLVATKLLPPYDPARIRASLDESLARLGRERVELLYLHRWDATGDTSAALTTLHELVQEGRAGAIGVSNFTVAQLENALKAQQQLGLARFQVLQNNHNFAVRDVTDEMRRLCSAQGVAVVTYSPLGAGFLTGKHRDGVAPGSRFDIMPGHQKVYFNETSHRRLARLADLAAKTGRSMTQLALAWALHQPGGATVLVGGRTPAHLDQAFDALAVDVPELYDESGSA